VLSLPEYRRFRPAQPQGPTHVRPLRRHWHAQQDESLCIAHGAQLPRLSAGLLQLGQVQQNALVNPVQRQAFAPSPTIRHYAPEVIEGLCSYVPAPDANPEEALVLYFIIFHALSVWELQHAQLPNLYPLHKGIASPTLAEAYHIRVPGSAPSLGDRSPGRPSIQVDFPEAAVLWLRPLLERYR